ncbi:Sec7 domain containing protein [Histomonas meleagridis]|uniref:Sec7 domain containing protein n=1 Tax=Histomonas meleagridis TaxID=135588 RepID=UPI003559DDDE|nr:Sec7 domain containing protein [Histomonas meleagridis]KAH0796901.1 Sec7 domain containing protein [Histomonas meleagridis]
MSRVELLSTLLSDLKKLCGFFHRPTKDSIAAAEAYLNKIKSNENDIDLKIVLNPFFVALEDDPKLFFQSILDSFTYIFKEQIFAKFLTKEIILKILNALRRPEKFSLTQEMTIEKYIALCGDFQKTIFLHGPFIETIIGILLRLHSISESLLPKKNIQEILIQIITTIFQEESTGLPNPSNYDSTTEYIQNLVKTIVINSEMIVDTLKPNISDDYVPTLKDSDCYSAINAFSSIIETNKLSLSTIQLSSACLIKALETKSKFFTTNIFKALLQTKIHVALITLIIDPRIELVDLTSKLFVLLWQRFAPIYNDNLNELFVRGLGTTLASPEQRTIIKSLKTFEYFTKYPQLLVDTFVNYDCDESGYYQNVFENSVSQIAKLSYPDSIQTPVQKKALNVLVSILKSLWKYFSEFRIGNSIAKEAPQGFLDAKKTKNELNIGLEIFKKSWKKGLEYFVQHNFIEDTPQSISKFLYSTPSLDPAQVGEILGNSSPKNIEILKSYMSLFNFKNQTFEQSFRTFLSSFQIPGEGQMIDRIMEQFGRKYYDDNPQYFSCADTVYVLAYSTLMLHTDAHHPSVKSRMTLDQFIANNRGIDNGKDLSYDFLKDLYQGICSKKIFTTSTLTSTNSSLLTRKQKAEMFKTRCKETLENARQRTITSTTMNAHEFHKSESPLLIGPMFDSIWGCVLGSLTITFSQSQQKEIYTKCLKGLTYAVHIASHCFVENALDTLVDSFAQFTGLRKLKYTEVQQKNIDCTNALIKFSIEDGNFLRNAWQIVMEELSAIERLKQTQNYSNMFIEADTLFSNSATQLDHESIIDFIQAICDASLNELKQNPPMTTLFIDLSRVSIIEAIACKPSEIRKEIRATLERKLSINKK